MWDDVFPMASEMSEQLTENDYEIVPNTCRHSNVSKQQKNAMFYNGCLMKDSIDDAVASQVRNILGSLKEAIEMRLKPLLANPCFDLKAHMQVVANLLGDANCKWLQNK